MIPLSKKTIARMLTAVAAIILVSILIIRYSTGKEKTGTTDPGNKLKGFYQQIEDSGGSIFSR